MLPTTLSQTTCRTWKKFSCYQLLPAIYSHYQPPRATTSHLQPSTSHLQPLDADIIQSFKSHFCRQHINLIIDQTDQSGRRNVLVSHDILFIKWTWNAVTPTTIKHCWQYARLVSRNAPDLSVLVHDDDIPIAKMLYHATNTLNIDENATMIADEFVPVYQDVIVFDESILDIMKGGYSV